MLSKLRYFLFLLTVLVLIVVAFQNQQAVDIRILFFSGRYPLTLLLLGTSVLSFLLGSVLTIWRTRRKKTSLQHKEPKKPKESAHPKKPAESETVLG